MTLAEIKKEMFSNNQVLDLVDYQDVRSMPNEADIRWQQDDEKTS